MVVKEENISEVASLGQEERLRSKTMLQKAMWRLRRDRVTLSSIFILFIIVALSFSAPLFVSLLDVDYNDPDPFNTELGVFSRVSDSDTTAVLWAVDQEDKNWRLRGTHDRCHWH